MMTRADSATVSEVTGLRFADPTVRMEFCTVVEKVFVVSLHAIERNETKALAMR